MADVTIDMDECSLEDAADRLDEAGEGLGGESLTVALRNFNPREAVGFIEGALDAGYEVSVTEIATDTSSHGSVIEMIQNKAEVVHIEQLTAELRS